MACAAAAKNGGSSFSDRHARLLLAQINRLRAGESFCDVRLEVGPEAFAVHRLVLAASSPYFAALFASGMKESGRDVVRIAGVEADTFHTLLDFIYTGKGWRRVAGAVARRLGEGVGCPGRPQPRAEPAVLCLPAGVVSIAEHNVQELIVAADMLQLTEVVELCCEFLKGQIDPLNCIGLFQFSEQIACHDLMEFSESYIHAHFLEVQSGEEFLALTKEQLVKILRSEDLSIEDEYQVFIAAMQWILKDVGKRKKYVVEVLEPVRFPLLPAQKLLKYIESK